MSILEQNAAQLAVQNELKNLDNTVAGITPETDTYATPAVGGLVVAGLLLAAFMNRKRIASGIASAKEAAIGLFDKKKATVAE